VSETRCVGAGGEAVSLQSAGMSHLLGYARVSTVDQDPALQLDALTTAGCQRIYTDRASGTLTARPQLDLLLDHALAGDTVCVWRLDRLGRSLPHLIATVTGLHGRGVGFRSLQESIDTTTATGTLIFHLLAALSAFERDLLSERTHAGLAAARARGRVGGRPSKMTPEKLDVARRMLAEGIGKAVIARTIGVSRPSLYDHLKQHPPHSPSSGPGCAGL